jgi:hydroxypyruvate isomerase
MAAEIIAELGLSHVRLQFDLFHTQVRDMSVFSHSFSD